MTRIPVLSREDMNVEQQRVHDAVKASTGRVGKGPSVGYAYSPGLWELHNASSLHLLDCALTPAQVRIAELLTVRHWKAAYPWSAQAASALSAGLDLSVVEAINAGRQPEFADKADETVHAVARELLATGTLGNDSFEAAKSTIGYAGLADVIGTIGHFSATAMMANAVGAEAPADAPSFLKA